MLMVKYGREEGELLCSGQNRKHLSVSFSNHLVGVLASNSFSALLTELITCLKCDWAIWWRRKNIASGKISVGTMHCVKCHYRLKISKIIVITLLSTYTLLKDVDNLWFYKKRYLYNLWAISCWSLRINVSFIQSLYVF